ncbi:MAG: glycosyltransferase family 2 protein [Phycisphaerales bacterium]|nr:MAG: glycosyltransferase family 2 protein [Phycisphaerales bacterium]
MSPRPRVSFVIATHNRRDVLAHTLDHLADCGLDTADFETIVVDNASTDGTVDVADTMPNAQFLRLRRNLGSCAKAIGADRASAPLLVFLDDDSWPRPGAIERMIHHFERDPRLGAAGFTVSLPDGSEECSALPHVFVGCGVGLRARALRSAGGLDPTFFMQAEEYDLAFRLMSAGWNVEVFSDLAVIHGKSAAGRDPERTTYYDIRNNLRVVGRHLPPPFRGVYQKDWLQRYGWLAQASNQTAAYRRGAVSGRIRASLEQGRFARRRLSAANLEKVFCWSFIARRMTWLREQGVLTVLLADLGKNVYAFFRGAREAGLRVAAIADDAFARPGRAYRDIPVLTVEEALRLTADAIVVSNTSYAHAERRAADLASATRRVVYHWFPRPAATSEGEVFSAADAPLDGLTGSAAVRATRPNRPWAPRPACTGVHDA